jgi:predicted transcriptional regulator YdeE
MTATSLEPEIVEYGPCRVIGMRYVGKNEHGEVPALWGGESGFIARFGEVVSPPDAKWQDSGRHPAFGLCRCLPGVTDGSFEYLAATVAAADAPLPEGMVEATIPAGQYAAFPVDGLARLREAFGAAQEWLAAHPVWGGYCDREGCDCANHPAFELYPPDFGDDGQMFVYLPVRPRA